MKYTIKCPNCGAKIEMEVDLGDHYVDVPTECDCCDYGFTQKEQLYIHEKAWTECWQNRVEQVENMISDR